MTPDYHSDDCLGELRRPELIRMLSRIAQRHCAMAVRPTNGTPRRRSRENRNG